MIHVDVLVQLHLGLALEGAVHAGIAAHAAGVGSGEVGVDVLAEAKTLL